MSENVTLEAIVDDDGDIFEEVYDHSEEMAGRIMIILRNFERCYIAVIIVIGIPCNILALLLLVRRRLWHHHEAYVYVAAILIINILELVIRHSNRWLDHMDHNFSRFSTIADITCKLWHWAMFMLICISWLHVLMLLNVYLRQQLMTSSDRRGFFMNLASKYCSLLGTKVVVISFFAFCAVAYFWNFAISSLEEFGESWFCSITININWNQYKLLETATVYFGMTVPLIVGILLILLIVWKIKRSSRFVFSQLDGAHAKDDSDVEAMTKIVLCCATVFFVLRAPQYIVHVMYIFEPDYVYNIHFHVASNAVLLISFSSPLSTSIVCFTVKSRFRNELRSMIKECCCRHCCPGTKLRKILPQEADDNDSSVLQMDPIEVDLNTTVKGEESNFPNCRDT